ncbi:MAG: hypothetical protein FJ245_07520 [Nitrospira sp.]|nr:hypothetical protein [Nitrospira sp.]
MNWINGMLLACASVLLPGLAPGLAQAEMGPDKPSAALPIGPLTPTVGEQTPLSEERQGRIASPQEPDLASMFTSGDYTYFPLPAFGYSRNESFYIGSLMPILKANSKGEIDDILAPQYLYNEFVGNSLTLNYYGYRSDTVQYRAIVNYADRVQKNFDFSYKDLGAGGGRYILGGQVNFFKNPFARFFGFGNGSSLNAETDFTARETNINAYIGINLSPDFSVILTGRYRDVRVENGIIPTLPQTSANFRNTPGVDGAQMTGGKLSLLYDTRDSQLTPVKGVYMLLSAELVSNVQHDEPNRWLRFTLDARRLIPHDGGSKVFVARVVADGIVRTDNTRGRDIPFYERPMLGGETTLRAFGLNRFISDQMWLINLEERIRMKDIVVMDHHLEFELAPNLDMGRVFQLADEPFAFRQTQINPGLGFRVMAKPHVVGRLDISYGRDGSNAFVGVDYPF